MGVGDEINSTPNGKIVYTKANQLLPFVNWIYIWKIEWYLIPHKAMLFNMVENRISGTG